MRKMQYLRHPSDMLNKYKQKYEVPKHLQEAYQIKDHIFSFSYLLNISHDVHTKLGCSSYCNCQGVYLVYCGDSLKKPVATGIAVHSSLSYLHRLQVYVYHYNKRFLF